MNKFYTPYEISRIRTLAKTLTAKQVAEKLGRTTIAIQQAAFQRGIKFGVASYHKHTTKEVSSVLSLRCEGKTFREIAEVTGLKADSCRHLCRRYG